MYLFLTMYHLEHRQSIITYCKKWIEANALNRQIDLLMENNYRTNMHEAEVCLHQSSRNHVNVIFVFSRHKKTGKIAGLVFEGQIKVES